MLKSTTKAAYFKWPIIQKVAIIINEAHKYHMTYILCNTKPALFVVFHAVLPTPSLLGHCNYQL